MVNLRNKTDDINSEMFLCMWYKNVKEWFVGLFISKGIIRIKYCVSVLNKYCVSVLNTIVQFYERKWHFAIKQYFLWSIFLFFWWICQFSKFFFFFFTAEILKIGKSYTLLKGKNVWKSPWKNEFKGIPLEIFDLIRYFYKY